MNGVSAQHYNCMDGVITFLCIHFLAWAHTADWVDVQTVVNIYNILNYRIYKFC